MAGVKVLLWEKVRIREEKNDFRERYNSGCF